MTAQQVRDSSRAAPHPRFGVGTVEIDGFTFLDVSEQQFVDLVFAERREGRGGWVMTPNVDIMRQARADASLAKLFGRADAFVADGMPILWASRVQGTPLRKGRVCGANLIYAIPATCAEQGRSVFLLGGAKDTGERTAAILKSEFPGLHIAGTYSPPFGFESDPEQYQAMETALLAAQPDFIFVALSVPKSEMLIQKIRSAAPDAWWIGVGAAFDFVSGELKRAPPIAQRFGMEWLFRMVQDPRRLIRRYLWDDLPYACYLFASAVRRRFNPSAVRVASRNSAINEE